MSEPRAHALYRFFDAEGVLLYVGITVRPWQRWKEHAGEKSWWHDVASVAIERHETAEAAATAEREAIRSEKPLYNIAHTNKARGPRGPQSGPGPIRSLDHVPERIRKRAKEVAEHIESVVASAPPLTDEQRERIAYYLRRDQEIARRLSAIAEAHEAARV